MSDMLNSTAIDANNDEAKNPVNIPIIIFTFYDRSGQLIFYLNHIAIDTTGYIGVCC